MTNANGVAVEATHQRTVLDIDMRLRVMCSCASLLRILEESAEGQKPSSPIRVVRGNIVHEIQSWPTA